MSCAVSVRGSHTGATRSWLILGPHPADHSIATRPQLITDSQMTQGPQGITPAYWPRLTWCHLTGYWLNRDAVIEEAITATTNSQRNQTNDCFGPEKPKFLENKSLQASGTKKRGGIGRLPRTTCPPTAGGSKQGLVLRISDFPLMLFDLLCSRITKQNLPNIASDN